jgi:hypothetical protein
MLDNNSSSSNYRVFKNSKETRFNEYKSNIFNQEVNKLIFNINFLI